MRESLASSCHTENMDLFQNEYFATTRNLMLLIGQWPDYASRGQPFKTLFICIVFVSAFCILIGKFVTTKCTVDLLVEMAQPLIIVSMCFTKYCTVWIFSAKMRTLMDYIRFDWRTIQCKDEMAILRKYANFGRLYSLFYAVLAGSAVVIFVVFYSVPCVILTFSHTNWSFTCKQPFNVEYFVDQDKYFYPILMHISVTIFVTHLICVTTDMFYILVLLHASGTFGVLGYRLEHIFDSVSSCGKDISDLTLTRQLYKKIANCVQFHEQISKYIRILHSCYLCSYLIQVSQAVLLLTSLLLALSDLLAANGAFSEIVGLVVHISGVFLAMFMNIFPGQILLNSSADIFVKAYSGKWYFAPLAVRRSLLVIMQRTKQACGLSAANIVTTSLPTLSGIVQTSVSYFTVLCSIRETPKN